MEKNELNFITKLVNDFIETEYNTVRPYLTTPKKRPFVKVLKKDVHALIIAMFETGDFTPLFTTKLYNRQSTVYCNLQYFLATYRDEKTA